MTKEEYAKGMLDDRDSFARSQAEKFAEWITTATAMCSSGFETQNFKYRTNDDSRTNVE